MREILFRGKRIDNGRWVSGSLFKRTTNCYIFPLPIATEAHKAEVDPETVGQYIGLTDKNGKKIFEGDILKKDGRKYSVCYYPTFAMYMLSILPKGGGSNGMMTQIFDCEVIGNIHDNPEV